MIREMAEKYKEYVIELRRELHMNPGLSWQEFEAKK